MDNATEKNYVSKAIANTMEFSQPDSNSAYLTTKGSTVSLTPSSITSSGPLVLSSSVFDVQAHPAVMVAPKSGRRTQPQDPRNLIQPRRSSTRSIKRKKFDDELVESSLVKSDRGRLKAPSAPLQPTTPTTVPASTTTTQSPQTPVEKAEPVITAEPHLSVPHPEKKKVVSQKIPQKQLSLIQTKRSTQKTSKSSSKRVKKQKNPAPGSTKDLGRWKPQDDVALVTAVQQTNDLNAVYTGVKFSCHFTLKEIQERWYSLLYDPTICKLALQAMKQLHPDNIAAIQGKALFSQNEENLLAKIPSTSSPQLEVFQELLIAHPETFHPLRTPKTLLTHWQLMKQYHLLPDQSVQPMPRGDHVLNYSDAEDILKDVDLKDPPDDLVEHELTVTDRRNKREIRHLEQELPKWQVLVDSVTGISPPDFDNQTLAVLRGRLVRYLMRSREITLGRATREQSIDVDLSLEGPAWKISRRQGVIKLRNNGDFFIANEGKRPIHIDGKPVLVGNKQKLFNNSVVEISCLRFIFLINQDLISTIRSDSQKQGTASS